MKISEFCKKYNVDRRSVQYWTEIGLLHSEICGRNNYNDYGSKAEEEIKLILIAKAMGGTPLEDYVDMLNHLPNNVWDTLVIPKIKEEMNRVTSSYKQAIQYTLEIRGKGV